MRYGFKFSSFFSSFDFSGFLGMAVLASSTASLFGFHLHGSPALAQIQDPKAALQDWLQRQLTAANGQDLDSFFEAYSPDFSHQDGLNLEQTRTALSELWESYDPLTYSGRLQTWERRGSDLVATFEINLAGEQLSDRGSLDLVGFQVVQNHFRVAEDGPLLLIRQEVITEAMTLTSGDNPPTVTLRLPDQIRPGSSYRLEAIVQEPIHRNLLLGTFIDEPVTADRYLEVSSFPLEPLQAGGIFRQADAPNQPGSDWISVMFVNQGGLTLESRRITIR